MKVNRNTLLERLDICRPGLSHKEIIEETIRFIFTGENITTFNDEICILAPYPTDFQCSVNGEELYKILSGIKEDEVDITLENDQMRIKSKKTRAGLSTIIGEKERVDSLVKKLQDSTFGKGFWRRLPKDFVEGITLCMFNASKDMTTGVRCCVAVNEDKIYSSDSVRISRFIMDGTVKEMLIPARNAVELVKYPIKKYGKSEGWLHFITDDQVMFNCRMMVGEYPYTIDRFFEKKSTYGPFTMPDELGEIMKSIVIMATGDEVVAKMVEMKIEEGKITCRSEKERGWIEKEVDFEYTGKPLIFYINPIFFAQILTKATALSLTQGEEFPDKATFSQEKYRHMIALPE